ncbi:MAG: ASKHA domain-containing protein [Verrucomicrobiia bacterium]
MSQSINHARSVIKLEVESSRGSQVIVVLRDKDRRLTDILRREHLPLNTRCGERGLCDGCIVELLAGNLIRIATGETVQAGHKPVSVRGCEFRLGDTTNVNPDTGVGVKIRIPPRSLLAHKPQIVSEFRTNVPRAHDPLWKPAAVPRVSAASLEPVYGAAIDVGTTTVAALLVDLSNGEIVGHAADFNKQMHFGDDVATRISLCSADPTMLGHLQDAVVKQTIAPLLAEMLRQAKAGAGQLTCLAVTGNTIMLHLLAGVDPVPMGVYPFTPGFLDHRVIQLPAFGNAVIHLFPSAVAYIGADLTAGIFSSGLVYDDGPSLLVDVGTNGEIILKKGDHLLGCATAAGPAFEGAGLTNGIRATAGAIERVRFTKEPFAVHTDVIGNPPVGGIGLCGSAYVDFLAEGRRIGLLTSKGRFDRARVADASAWLHTTEDSALAFRVARGQGKRDIVVSEADIAHLLQSKAAIAAGILTLLEKTGLTPAQIKTIYLAGGFGMHLNVGNAIGCGLLPGFKVKQVEVVGNTSLAGAYLGLLDRGVLDEITRIGKKIEIVELNLDSGFESRYIDQLSLPD